jgi:hypothetical protein
METEFLLMKKTVFQSSIRFDSCKQPDGSMFSDRFVSSQGLHLPSLDNSNTREQRLRKGYSTIPSEVAKSVAASVI